MEDMKSGVIPEQRKWKGRALVVAGNDQKWNTFSSNLENSVDRELSQARLDSASEKNVTAVENNIDLTPKRRLEGCFETPPEIRPPPASSRAGSGRHVESEVGIRKEENPDHGAARPFQED